MFNKLEKLIIATGNKGKFEELKAMLSGANKNFADEIIFAPEFAEQINIVEDGSSYEENAEIKARAWAEISGLPCLADDSGLEVEALNNAPGIYSARIIDGDDNARNLWLLDKLKNFKDKNERRARFAASLVLVFNNFNNNKIIAKGFCEGYIAEKISGLNGFGYDPIFIPKGFDVTFAALSSEIKNKISHRALAVKNLLENFKN